MRADETSNNDRDGGLVQSAGAFVEQAIVVLSAGPMRERRNGEHRTGWRRDRWTVRWEVVAKIEQSIDGCCSSLDRTHHGGLNECSITIHRGGKITKSATAVPGSSLGQVSTV